MNKKQEVKIIKTYKVKHGLKSTSFLEMFDKAYQVALFSQNEKQLKNKFPSSKHVKHINLKSEIAIQVIRKYYNNKKLKIISKKYTKKYNKKNNFTLNSWPFFKFKQLLTYKAILSGIRVIEIDPMYTSQDCSKCSLLGSRTNKLFKCNNKDCMHIDHADVNAAFNIASRPKIDSVENEINRRGAKARSSTLPLTPSSSNDSKSESTTEPTLLL